MPRTYAVTFEGVTVTSAGGDTDLFEFTPADDKPIELVGLIFATSSELGDAAEEIIRFQVSRGHATSSNGTSATPTPLDPIDTAAGFTAEYNGRTIASTGTNVAIHSDMFNVRSGYQMWWPDGCGPRATQANTMMTVRMMAAVADDVTMSGTAYIREG